MAERASTQHDKSSESTGRQNQAQQVNPGASGSARGVLRRAQAAPGSLRPADVLQLQRTIGNRATGRLLQAKLKLGPAGDVYEQEADRVAQQVVRAVRKPPMPQEESEGETVQTSRYADSISTLRRSDVPVSSRAFVPPKLQRQAPPGNVIQRAPDLARLEDKLGKNKYGKVMAAKQSEYFDKLTDDQLLRYRAMQNTQFDELVASLKESLLSSLAGKTADIAQIADLLGSAVETGEDAAEVAKMLPVLLNTMSGVVSTGADTAMEGFGGGIGGIKDTIEGGSSMAKQQKYVEGGLTTLSGLSGIASLIPGVPDVVGMAGAGAKSVAGMTKMANTKINQNAITRLKAEASTNAALIAALDILQEKLGYWEGAQQTVLGAVEGTGAFFGGLGKWGTSLFSKGVETLPGLLSYTGRAIGSTITSAVDSNATVKGREKGEKAGEMAKMRAAVETADAGGLPDHIGRLHRLVMLIEPDYAEEIDRAVDLLSSSSRGAVKAAIKLKATWNPS